MTRYYSWHLPASDDLDMPVGKEKTLNTMDGTPDFQKTGLLDATGVALYKRRDPIGFRLEAEQDA